MNRQQLAAEIRRELTEHIIPFWQRLRDEENGGYYGFLDYDLNLNKKAEKGCILNSRITWFFSAAYKLLGDPRLLDEARHGFVFMRDFCIDREKGGIYWSLDYKGNPVDTTKHTYNQAFAIYALSAYYEVSKDLKALQMADDLFELIETKMRDEGGYLEAFDRDFNPAGNDKLSENGVEAARTMNTTLHVLEAYTEYFRVGKRAKAENCLRDTLKIFENHIYDHDKNRLLVFMDHDYHSIIDLYSYGHDIEAAWLLDRAATVLGDIKLITEISKMTSALAEHVYEEAFDGKSIPVECEEGTVKQDRVWWVQAEAMNGYLNEWQKDRTREEYLETVYALWDYITEFVIDKRKGSEWFWYVNPDGTPATDPIVEPWKCPYHNGRMCIEMLTRIADVDKSR